MVLCQIQWRYVFADKQIDREVGRVSILIWLNDRQTD